MSGSARDCNPTILKATQSHFEMFNPRKESNFILGEVISGELTFIVENLPRTTPQTGCRGRWMFDQLMIHFLSFGTLISAIVGSWTYGDNLAIVNRLTSGANGLSLDDAVRQTLTAYYAASWNYGTVTISVAQGVPGHYTHVRVQFSR